jgi:hypothetical protein
MKKVGSTITELLLKDISVVDIPCNPESYFTVIKFDKTETHNDDCDCEACKKTKTEKIMSAELTQKVDTLTKQIEGLVATVETLTKAAPVDLTKVLADIGDLQKRAEAAQAAAATGERTNLIAKMDSEGRVAFNPETGVAYTADELSKLDTTILKVLSKNSAVIPTQARAIYKGAAKPVIDPALKGSALIEKAWEADYGKLSEMKTRFN